MYGVHHSTVTKWHRRWRACGRRFEALYNRSNRPRRTRARKDLERRIRPLWERGLRGHRLLRELRRRRVRVSTSTYYSALHRMGLLARRAARKRKPPRKASYPFGWVQVDVKYVASGGPYQFTAIECLTRVRFVRIYEDISPASAVDFIRRCARFFPFPIRTVSTDWGAEFTFAGYNHVHRPHPFERALEELGIRHHLIQPGRPQQNGRVERSHRTDKEDFYAFVPPAAAAATLVAWLKVYNERREHMALGWRTPLKALQDHLGRRVRLDYSLVD
jgi:transposase InsO family protein